MKRKGNSFRPRQIVILTTLYNDDAIAYWDLQSLEILLNKSFYTYPDRAKRLQITAWLYAVTQEHDYLNVIDWLLNDIIFNAPDSQLCILKLRELIALQKRKPVQIDKELNAIIPLLVDK